MLKGKKIGSDLDSFCNEHPEIKILRKNGKIVTISIPEDAELIILHLINSEIFNLEYLYNGEIYRFPNH